MLVRAIKYSAAAITAATGLSGYSLATGQLEPVNYATLALGATVFNNLQSEMHVSFDNAWVCLASGEFRAANLAAQRSGSAKSNFNITSELIRFKYGEPIANLLRSDAVAYIKSKQIPIAKLEISGCKASVELVKEKRIKTAEEMAAKLERARTKKGAVVDWMQLRDVTIDVVDKRKTIWAPGQGGIMRRVLRKVDHVEMPRVEIGSLEATEIRSRHAAFDLYTNAEMSARIGGTGLIFLGSGATSDGENCMDRKFVALDVPLDTAFSGYLAFPLNLIAQAQVDINVVSKPVSMNRDTESYDYLHDMSVSFKEVKAVTANDEDAAAGKSSVLRDATAVLVQKFLDSASAQRSSIDLNLGLVINEREFNKDKISSAIGAALIAKAIQGGLNILSTFTTALTNKKEKQAHQE